MATITHDTLDWYGWDEDGAGVHDVIGTRCDPYTNLLLKGTEYHHCCHSNLTRALATERNLPLEEAEVHVHELTSPLVVEFSGGPAVCCGVVEVVIGPVG
jgi:uncharacterized protein YcgI (DUF1989 family)